MPERVRVTFEKGTGGLVYAVTGEVMANAKQPPNAPPSLWLDKIRHDTPGGAALFKHSPVGINVDRIIAVEAAGPGHG